MHEHQHEQQRPSAPAPQQVLHPFLTTWHITWGTFATRLHGGVRPTVDRNHNQPGKDFIWRDPERERRERERAKSPPVILTAEQCTFIESIMPEICRRGGWTFRTCAAPLPPPRGHDGDHVHVLLDALPEAEPKVIRELLKRWLTQELNKRFPAESCSEPIHCEPTRHPARPRAGCPARGRAGSETAARGRAGSQDAHAATTRSRRWWAVGGSTKPVKQFKYLNNVFNYINRQRATPP